MRLKTLFTHSIGSTFSHPNMFKAISFIWRHSSSSPEYLLKPILSLSKHCNTLLTTYSSQSSKAEFSRQPSKTLSKYLLVSCLLNNLICIKHLQITYKLITNAQIRILKNQILKSRSLHIPPGYINCASPINCFYTYSLFKPASKVVLPAKR